MQQPHEETWEAWLKLKYAIKIQKNMKRKDYKFDNNSRIYDSICENAFPKVRNMRNMSHLKEID